MSTLSNSGNTFAPNHLTTLVLMRFLVKAPFLTVGAKKYFKDQLVGKRNGITYDFVIRDAGEVEGGTLTHNTVGGLKEQRIPMSLIPWHVMVRTDSIEEVTDVNWEDEIAKPNAAKLANAVVRDAVAKAHPEAATVFVSQGFGALAEAGAHLEDISSEKVYGFIDSKYQAVLTANGQQFNPVGSPNTFYSSGLLGTFHDVEYRTQRFFPKIRVTEAMATALNGATASVDLNAKTLQLTFAAAASADFVVKAGTPVQIDNVYACDLVGDVTNELFAFIASDDVEVSAGDADVIIPFSNIKYADCLRAGGTRILAQVDGSSFADAAAVGQAGTSICPLGLAPGQAETVYLCGQLRLDGAYEFETLDRLEASNAETKVSDIEGLKMFENRVVDLQNMTNDTRWDIVAIYGNVDPRGVANVYAS